jgi:hypothetical protein
MKRLMSAVFASLLFATAPAFAGGGHGDGDDHGDDKHYEKWEQKHAKKDRKAWEKQQKHWAKHDRGFREREVVNNNYYYPAPQVVERHVYIERPYSLPPAAFVSAPGIYIGFSN